jgi:predicted DNA-binding protein (MmcQ/YjbR family)
MAISEHEALGHLRAVCLALPEAVEKETWETQTFRVRDKIFAMRAGQDGRIAMWCKAPKGAQEVLVGSDPKRFFLPPYVAHKGWIGVWLDQDDTDWDEIKGLVIESYVMTAPKRLAALVDQPE